MFCLSRHFLLLVLKNYTLLTYRKPLLQLFRGHFVISFSHILIKDGAPEGTRTPGLLLRRQLLYPTELLAHLYIHSLTITRCCKLYRKMVRDKGLEPLRLRHMILSHARLPIPPIPHK